MPSPIWLVKPDLASGGAGAAIEAAWLAAEALARRSATGASGGAHRHGAMLVVGGVGDSTSRWMGALSGAVPPLRPARLELAAVGRSGGSVAWLRAD